MGSPLKERKSAPKWDAVLDRSMCDRYNNAELTLVLKIHFNMINPAGATGTFADFDGVDRKIIPWGNTATAWKQKFKSDCEKFWGGRLWLKSPVLWHAWDFTDKGTLYQPNIWCRFKIEMVSEAASSHKSIRAVRLHPSETGFRSDDRTYDDRDLKSVKQAHGGVKKTHVHEVGHAIGLPHVGVGDPLTIGGLICKWHVMGGGSTNDPECYGITDYEKQDAMGSGDSLRLWHAKPWQEALNLFTGGTNWEAANKRHYPRTLSEIVSGVWHTTRPNRG